MSEMWVAVAAMTVITFAIKAAGPVVLGGRTLPAAAERLIVLLPAALLTALVITQTFGDDRALVLDARAAGIAVAIVAAVRRAPMLVVLALAAATTALLRLVA